MTARASASALVAACKAGGLRAVRLLLDQGAPVTEEAWRAAASSADPALVFLLETADVTREPPPWLAAALAREEAEAGLAVDPAVHRRALAVALTASPGEAEVVEEALASALKEPEARGAVVSIDAVRARLPRDAATAGGSIGDLARKTEEVTETRQSHGCDACGTLRSTEEWGETIGGPDTPEPPEMKHLRRVVTRGGNTDVYRCPRCNAYFERATHEDTFISGNSTWYSYTLTRWVGPTDELDVYEVARTGDVARLAALLGDERDDQRRVRKLDALARLVDENYDAAPLASLLGDLAAAERPPAVREAAASVLARQALHALSTERVGEVAALVESGDAVLRAAALRALSQSRERSPAAVQECVRRIRPVLWTLATKGEDIHYTAGHLLSHVALDAEVIAQASRNLQGSDPRLREAATDVLAAAAEARLDVSATLPRLAALLRDSETGVHAAHALGAAHLRGADVAPFVPEMAEFLRAVPGTSRALDLTHVLHALQERGVDITAAFEALALDGRDWPMSVLQHAVERGRDVEAAVPELQRRVATDESYLGRVAAEVLATHFARKQDWERLTPLLHHPNAERAEAARTVVQRAVAQGQAPLEALYLLGRLQGTDAPADPRQTTWTQGRDNVEVNEREVLRWTEDGRGGIGTSCTLDAFLAGEHQLEVFQTFGARVLNEVVAAARRIARERKH